MTETQMRALWAAAFQSFAEAIAHGIAPIPTSVDFWSQGVSTIELLNAADNSTPEPLKVSLLKGCASVDVPSGRMLDLPIRWVFQAYYPSDPTDRERAERDYQFHNESCVPVEFVPVDQ